MSMDDRIVMDLTELYNEGATPGDIQNALILDGLVRAEEGQRSFATKALPGYYVGDRKAKTVMVMLNPGNGVKKSNESLMDDIAKHSMINAGDVSNYHTYCQNYGHFDRKRPDNFDLKQAFFLRRWKDTGIFLPNNLSPDSDRETMLEAKEIVLTQKLQLELIPYASKSISQFNSQKMHLLIPFVESLFDEIFSCERKYVIFCSAKFNDVFKAYNKQYPETVHFENKNVSLGKIGDSRISGKCSVVTIHYKHNEPIKALIANTFPSRALPNAYHLMEIYGELCYKEYIS